MTNATIENAINSAENDLLFCWDFLVDLKTNSIKDNQFTDRFIAFQLRLATAIFRLHSLRDKIIIKEKDYVTRRKTFNERWFKGKMRQLAGYKEGIDYVVNIAKAIGDAYAYFFYHNDLELLADHLSHQKVVNHTAGNGERGELEFLRNIKHIEGEFTLFHGITNILRYGDFSFIDLRKMKVTQIGELKTRWVAEDRLETNITLFRKKPGRVSDNKRIIIPELEKNRTGRQQLGIANLLKGKHDPNSSQSNLVDPSYKSEIQSLLSKTKVNTVGFIKASSGVAFSCVKLKKLSLYKHLSHRDYKNLGSKISKQLEEIVRGLIDVNSNDNAVLISSLLYDSKPGDKDIPGTVPLFWHEIDNDLLKEVYFGQTVVMSLFNGIHLINKIEDRGFVVKSNYYVKARTPTSKMKGGISYFDLFIPYITNHLFTENFVLGILDELEKSNLLNKAIQIQVKPQHQVEFFHRRRKPEE
ncbi:hypothetical protein SNE26_07615 [Mucilaginibacter sp. cycad4]|uniref:hypothetical protein n=1 Tax=Mucilaginibacter sp. cycad4 TaxID=3342096 RepID=UPI002AAC1F5F|nr:hypothetical protein [Mucilaginibacter gossypii]WPV01639.1 hypothetical protein SNE26_07615 [Mucilaginibacter gossypii]